MRGAGKRQWSLGRKSNKEFYQGIAMRGADNTEWWAMWKARYVMLNCSVQVSLFAASIFSRWERSSAQKNAVTNVGLPSRPSPQGSKVRTLPLPFTAFTILHPLTGCFHLPRQFPTARSSRLPITQRHPGTALQNIGKRFFFSLFQFISLRG